MVLLVRQLVLTSILVTEYIFFCDNAESISDFFAVYFKKKHFFKTSTLKLALLILDSVC